MRYSAIFLTIISLTLCACDQTAVALSYEIIAEKNHDASAYTQGLEYFNGRLFESTGLYTHSTLREVNPTNGEVLRNRPLASTIFGEGMTILNKQLWLLTWKEKTAYVYDPDDFKPLNNFTYQGEGWGLTNDGKLLIMSNGSNILKFINPTDFSTQKTLEVTDKDKPVTMLNELEWIDGAIYANIYLTDRIARISPESGLVTGWLDLSDLRKKLGNRSRAEVLNGIAYDKKTGHLLVTGKFWPKMFELKITENE